MNSRNKQKNIRRIDAMISACHILEIKVETATEYARVRVSLKEAGTPIPENDVWIAATCVQNNPPLATEDDHFSRVAGLQIISRG
jgi:tRNA(fMet)-specific endonuclease VapC